MMKCMTYTMNKWLHIKKHFWSSSVIHLSSDERDSFPNTSYLVGNKVVVLFNYLLGISQYKLKKEEYV